MIKGKFVITSESWKYTDYQSVYGKYKNKQYKIVSSFNRERSNVQGFLLTEYGYVELFHESDLAEYVHDYEISAHADSEDKLNVLQTRIEQAIAFIEKVY